MSVASGDSTLKENIYFDRFNHVPELNRLGCDISVDLKTATASIKGQRKLIAANVTSTDLRARLVLFLLHYAQRGIVL
ncbi:MAG: hypothetical protein Ct9H90mP15_02150 [Candidatus Neomarinimicrobiota bacterium]|nr:MAG: hypothetical protein Ct9H90mP15_02150 [Candidatus Neomarinimicrobiota bacterium]